MLLIFDEVQCGMGATGKNWCCEHFGVMPDLMAFGKKAQVCGVMAGPRLDEVKDNVFRLPSRINSTWGGNFTDMVRSTHFLQIIEEENLVENARVVGEHFLQRLLELQEEEPVITAVRGRGLLLAFDLPDPATREEFWKGVFDRRCLHASFWRTLDSFSSCARHDERSGRRSRRPAPRAMHADALSLGR